MRHGSACSVVESAATETPARALGQSAEMLARVLPWDQAAPSGLEVRWSGSTDTKWTMGQVACPLTQVAKRQPAGHLPFLLEFSHFKVAASRFSEVRVARQNTNSSHHLPCQVLHSYCF